MHNRHFLFPILLIWILAGCGEGASPYSDAPPAASQSVLSEAEETLRVHFIDVGQADAALLLCGGQSMLIDGGNTADSSLLVSYLDRQGIGTLDYMVCTHAHEDHVGGLSGPLNACEVRQVFSPVTEYDSKAFQDFAKYTQAQGLSITVPQADDTFSLGSADVTVLGPRQDYDDTNNTSLVLRVTFGDTAFLFTGDAERTAEADLLDAGCELSSTVLKVGHHGSDTSTSYPFLREVMPTYAVISVGEDNAYGHPHQETMSRLYDAGVIVYRTDLQGTVVAVSDGTEILFSTQRNTPPIAGRDLDTEIVYIGNLNSKVFHRESCSGLPAPDHRVYFSDREEAVTQGYRSCGNCQP